MLSQRISLRFPNLHILYHYFSNITIWIYIFYIIILLPNIAMPSNEYTYSTSLFLAWIFLFCTLNLTTTSIEKVLESSIQRLRKCRNRQANNYGKQWHVPLAYKKKQIVVVADGSMLPVPFPSTVDLSRRIMLLGLAAAKWTSLGVGEHPVWCRDLTTCFWACGNASWVYLGRLRHHITYTELGFLGEVGAPH